MNKIIDALKLAENTLEDIIRVYKFETGTPVTALAAIREALAEQSKCACDSPAWCTKYKKCNREMLGLPKAESVQEPVVHYKKALDAWFEKTEWVQETAKPKELGMHRADVLKQRIHELEKQLTTPVSAKREWVELEPWQLCEIEERISLPIDSHDFETIGNAYIAAFKEKNSV